MNYFYTINTSNIHLNEMELIEKLKTDTIDEIHKNLGNERIILYKSTEGILNRYMSIEYKYFPEFYGNIHITDFDSSLIDYLTLK